MCGHLRTLVTLSTALPEECPAAENRTWSVLAFFSPNRLSRTHVLGSPVGTAGWSAKTTADGTTYYENHATKSTTWDRPVAPAAVPAAVPPSGGSQGCEFRQDSGRSIAPSSRLKTRRYYGTSTALPRVFMLFVVFLSFVSLWAILVLTLALPPGLAFPAIFVACGVAQSLLMPSLAPLHSLGELEGDTICIARCK